MQCQHCKSDRTEIRRTSDYHRRGYCYECKRWFDKLPAPKVLLFDIETSHMDVKLWHTGDQRVRWQQIVHDNYVICWAAKWLFGDEVMSNSVGVIESLRRDDSRVLKSIYDLLARADFVITHNGDRFDIKILNWKFIQAGLSPNNRYKSINMYKKSKQIFKAPSHALDYLCQELGYNGKHHTDEELWYRVESGEQSAINEMTAYCENDVFMVEDLYLRLRGWIQAHPNFAQYVGAYIELEEDEYMCPRCTHVEFENWTGEWQTPSGYIYKTCNCGHCGAILRQTVRKTQPTIRIK